MSHHKPQVKFKYVFADNYNPVYVNGAHGGLTPRGELIVNFYLERVGLPKSITHELAPDGTLGAETGQEPADAGASIVRFVENGVILTRDNARMIHDWLGERLKELEAMEQAKAGAFPKGTAGDFTH